MRLLLLCGPPFSGKTSLARVLRAQGFLAVSLDDILREAGLEPGQGPSALAWEDASRSACSTIAAAARTGQDVVIDDTLCFRFLRDRYRDVGVSAGMSVILVVLVICPANVQARVELNRHTHLRQDIGQEVLEAHLDSFEWPGVDEPHITLDAVRDVDQQLLQLTRSAAWTVG
jgi:predicted kinase